MMETTSEADPQGVQDAETVPLDEAFLSIPDEENEAIDHARNTFDIALIGVVVFVAIVVVFVL